MQLPNEIKGILSARVVDTEINITSSKAMIPLALTETENEVIDCNSAENKLAIDSDGYVVVGKKVSRILILGKVYLGYSDSDAINYDYFSTINMIRNSNTIELDWSVASGLNSRKDSFQGARQTTNICFANVKEGDKIYLAGRLNGTNSNDIVALNQNRTKLVFIIL